MIRHIYIAVCRLHAGSRQIVVVFLRAGNLCDVVDVNTIFVIIRCVGSISRGTFRFLKPGIVILVYLDICKKFKFTLVFYTFDITFVV